MTYSRVTYLVHWGTNDTEEDDFNWKHEREFMTLHEAIDVAQAKLFLGQEVLITPLGVTNV